MEITYNPFLVPTSPAIAEAASHLGRLIEQTRKHLADSLSLGASQQDSLRRLHEVLLDCGLSDWDGYGAEPISVESYERTKRLILSLPFNMPRPEISADPDGEITLEWYQGPSRVFSVSVGSSNQLNYAGIFGASRAYGTEVFHDEIPQVVLSHIKRALL